MTLLLGAIGWGLLAIGAATHLWHHDRLRELLAMHLDHERVPAAILTALEMTLTVIVPVGYFTNATVLRVGVALALVLAIGFVAWIGRLLATGSVLPCACSFSEAPTSLWSLARASAVALIGFFLVAGEVSTPNALATLSVGLGLATALFLVPEAIAWPEASRAVMTRVDAHSGATSATTTP